MNETSNSFTVNKNIDRTDSQMFNSKASIEINQYPKERDITKATQIKDKIIQNWERSINERRVFKYGYWLIFHYILCWVKCRKEKSMRLKKNFRDQVYYNVGQDKLVNELDWVTIIKSIRRLKILTQILLNKKQRFLLKFQRNEVIDSSSSGTSDEGQINIIDLMKSSNTAYKKMINGKIQRNMTSLKNKPFKDIDIRIIKGSHFLVYLCQLVGLSSLK